MVALRLGPDRGEPHLAAAEVAFHCDLDYETALAEVGIGSAALLPNAMYPAARYMPRTGHWGALPTSARAVS